jgi:hypothetical protein
MVSAYGFGTSKRGNTNSHIFEESPVNEKKAKGVPGPGNYQPPSPESVKKRSPTWRYGEPVLIFL